MCKKLMALAMSAIALFAMAGCGEFGASSSSAEDTTFTLTFETGGKVEVPAMEVEIGETPALPQTPEAEGYVFTGWYFDEEMTNRYFFDYPLYEDETLYAQFYDTTLGEYHVISTIDQWMEINEDPTAKYLLARNINGRGETLTPIDEFSGELEGNGYKIFNFSINETTETSGLIRTNSGTVSNLSVGDFTFDILVSSKLEKSYGIVAAVNNGTITNCHILDSEMKLNITNLNANLKNYIGAIAGHNFGMISGCTNRGKIKVDTVSGPESNAEGTWTINVYIGGLAGLNEAEASLMQSKNYGEIVTDTQARGRYWTTSNIISTSSHYGIAKVYPCVGGISGFNMGMVDACSTESKITGTTAFASTKSREIHVYFGQGIGQNDGEIRNSYAKGTLYMQGELTTATIGGFVALNKGKAYNCYTTSDILCELSVVTAIGGFVGDNQLVSGYPATVNKCFTIGGITMTVAPTDSGLFAGKNTGTLKDSYYADAYAINLKTIETAEPEEETSASEETPAEPKPVEKLTPIETTCTDGSAAAMEELLSMNFQENTLYFDRTIWILREGELPTLR